MCYTCRSPDSRNIQSWKLKKKSKTGEWIWMHFSLISYDTNKLDSFLLSDFLPICHLVKFRLSGSVTLLFFWWLITGHFQSSFTSGEILVRFSAG